MVNTGFKKIASIFLVFILLFPLFIYSDTIENSDDSIHFKMLKKLNIEPEEESLLRRGEIVFFISFGYLWMYQFLLYDQILQASFRDKTQIGKLSDKNLYFAVITSAIIALFIARNDSQFIHYVKAQKVYNFEDKIVTYQESFNNYNWYFNFFSWEF
ncbi:MAG TPA: hypothetical protein PKW55_03445 [Spirochaetota bacterium]|nr:hypothetical protein [Spirochaetota bacterium]HOM38110.1 hypothetical protein [Spirochaetota bacterium]HPQ48912.1 hypothetical protein [Spirochaetota bacterium]